MELMQQEVKGYSDSREEEEEEEEATEIIIPRERAESSSSSSRLYQQADAASNFINIHRKQLDFMDLSLGNNKDDVVEANFQGSGSSSTTTLTPTPTHHGHGNNEPVEKEHMFDKVVTPSDVGKLNRLVIPKQHAEKYFPLDSSANEKGLLLNFEDRNGKPWRFRYSYWNSSQSYVMTKGWSRFVKEKKLDAGDIVSFQRGLGDSFRHRLYIDWRRRPDHAPNHSSATMITPLFLPNQPHLSPYSVRWGGRLYSLPSSPPTSRHHHHDHLQQQQLNYNNMYTFPQQQQQQHREYHQQFFHGGGLSHHHNNYNELMMNSGSGSLYYLRSTPSMSMGDQNNNLTGQQQDRVNIIAPMIIDSVPVAHHHHHRHLHHGDKSSSGASSCGTSGSASPSAAGKRLRLFGVNMECASSSPAEEPKCCRLLSPTTSVAHVTMANSSLPSSSLQPLQRLRVPHEDPLSSSARLGDQRGGTSMLFDLDPSLQYRQ